MKKQTPATTMIVAPVLGVAVDFVRGQGLGGEFWPVAAVAAVVALFILITPLKEKTVDRVSPESIKSYEEEIED